MNEIVIGNKIAEGRKKLKLSQAQFAQMLCVSPQAVSKWERGESLPDIVMLNKIAQAIETDMNYFADIDSDNKNTKEQSQGKNMAFANWKNADFSGLERVEKMGCSNIENCKFIGANLKGIVFKANNINKSDFSNANLENCKITMTNIEKNNFSGANMKNALIKGNIDKNNFTNTNLTNAVIKSCDFDENDLTNAILDGTQFIGSNIKEVTFGGELVNCSFVNCNFSKTKFTNCIMKNVFFKGKAKRVLFTNCKADKLTHEFLNQAGADLTNVELI